MGIEAGFAALLGSAFGKFLNMGWVHALTAKLLLATWQSALIGHFESVAGQW